MEAGGLLPGPDRPVPAEIVHESGRTRITQLVLPGGTVIRKEPLGPDGERRVRHEVAVLERLRGVAGVAQLAEAPRYPGSVVLADAGGASLAAAAKPLAADELAGLAVGLGRAVAAPLSGVIMHLLEKKPDNRYQTADGLPTRRFPPTSTPATRWHNLSLISVVRTRPPSSAIRPAWNGTPRPPCP